MSNIIRYSWQFMLAACVLLFIACAQLPGPARQDDAADVPVSAGAPETLSGGAAVAPVLPSNSEESLPADSVSAQLQPGAAGAAPALAGELGPMNANSPVLSEAVQGLCDQIGNKLGSVSVIDCKKHEFRNGGGHSVHGRPLVIKEILPTTTSASEFKVLIMGGIHGDEYSSISILFKWLELFSTNGLEGEFKWRFAPLVNPDGLLDGQAKRQNANGVDLNRNFPSQDWNASAVDYWQESTGSNPRRFPGSGAASEPEIQWLVSQIEEFQPDVIVSVHAPYHLLDFDGPADAPDKIGELYLHQLGVYPGSLGNYAGLNKRIPVVTLELPSAGIMPPEEQISLMWRDLVAWLDHEGRNGLNN